MFSSWGGNNVKESKAKCICTIGCFFSVPLHAYNLGKEMRVITYVQKADFVEHGLLVLLQSLHKYYTQQKNE
jgi:hypothetical protein